MSPKEPKDDWNAWKNHVLATLERMEKSHSGIGDALDSIQTELASLRVKASVWGLLGGLIPAAGLIIVEILFFLLKGA